MDPTNTLPEQLKETQGRLDLANDMQKKRRLHLAKAKKKKNEQMKQTLTVYIWRNKKRSCELKKQQLRGSFVYKR